MDFVSTFWTLLPPIVAIALALITKEVYLSLLIGIISGALLYCKFNVLTTVETTFGIMGDSIGGNANILIFLVLLGIVVALITKSGASKAYGEWAAKTIKSKRGSLLATILLGSLIFVDDYFNCLTVGTVMRPVTDKYKVSRAKLAYIIDATAAPVCIIAPISSWAAAVGSSLPEDSGVDGFNLFLRTIPYNLYALLTIAFMLYITIRQIDFSAMKKYEMKIAETGKEETTSDEDMKISGKGKVIDLILPIIVLIVLCIAAMLYTGGILNGENIKDAFANCASSLSLVLGSFFTLAFMFVFYMVRKVISFREFCDSIVQGFKAMTPAITILCLAWTLSGICSADYLNLGGYVKGVVEASASSGVMVIGIPLGELITAIIPCIFFLVALGLAFATGTSWGTFGILIPIATVIIETGDINSLAFAVAAILAGAVCGDHISPISDTTILASAGAQCNHINHVSTQIPYAMCVAACCFVGYLVGGIASNGWIGLVVGFICLAVALVVITITSKKAEN